MEIETLLKYFSFHNLVFFFLQMTAIMMSLWGEKWLTILLGVELSTISFIPMISFHKKNQFLMTFFVMKTFASIFMIFGQMWFNSLFFVMGVFLKVSAFPLIWLPFVMKSGMNEFFLFWFLSLQKIPMYMLWNEVVLSSEKVFLVLSSITFMFCSIKMLNSKNILVFLGWKSICHSMMNLMLLTYLNLFLFLCVFIFQVMSLMLFFFLFSWKKHSLFFSKTSKSNLSILYFLAFMGLPLFVNVLTEMFLFLKLKKFWSTIIIVGLIFQVMAGISLGLQTFSSSKSKSFNIFKFYMMLAGLFILFFV